MCSSLRRKSYWGMVAFGLTVALTNGGLLWADAGLSSASPDIPEFSSWPLGHVTGTAEKAVEIDYRPYPLHPDLKIVDMQGAAKELKDLQRTYPIRYRTKGEKVDYVVIVLAP